MMHAGTSAGGRIVLALLAVSLAGVRSAPVDGRATACQRRPCARDVFAVGNRLEHADAGPRPRVRRPSSRRRHARRACPGARRQSPQRRRCTRTHRRRHDRRRRFSTSRRSLMRRDRSSATTAEPAIRHQRLVHAGGPAPSRALLRARRAHAGAEPPGRAPRHARVLPWPIARSSGATSKPRAATPTSGARSSRRSRATTPRSHASASSSRRNARSSKPSTSITATRIEISRAAPGAGPSAPPRVATA